MRLRAAAGLGSSPARGAGLGSSPARLAGCPARPSPHGSVSGPAPGAASSASASPASLFPALRLALGRRIRVFSGGGRTAVRTGLLAACSRPGMAPRRRHLCFFRRANPTFAGGPGPPAARCLSGSLPGSLGFPAGEPSAPAAVPRARHEPQTASRSTGAPAHFPFAGGWRCGAREPRGLRPLVGKLPPGTTRAPTPGRLRGPPTWRSGSEAAPTNTRGPEPGDSQPGRVGTRGEGSSPRGPITSWGSPGRRPPSTPNPFLPPGPSGKLSLEELEGHFQTWSLPPLEAPLPSTLCTEPPDPCMEIPA